MAVIDLRSSEDLVTTLRGRLLRSLPWAYAGSIASAALSFVLVLVSSRYLTPTEFGLAALTLVVTQFADLIVGSLVSNPIVQRSKLTPGEIDTAFWMAVALGSTAFLLLLAAAAPLARFYGEPSIQGYIGALAINPLLVGLGALPQALLTRELRVRAATIRLLIGRTLGLITATTLFVGDNGVWAVVVGTLTSSMSILAFTWPAALMRPGLHFSMLYCRQFVAFGWAVAADALLWSVVSRVFALLVGLFHGVTDLGYLNFAMRLVETVVGVLTAGANGLGLPMFSALQEQRAIVRRTFHQASRYGFALVAPAVIGFAAVADDAIPLLFGERWRPATIIVQIIALSNVIFSARMFAAPCMTALGHPRRNLATSFASAAVVVAGAFATQHASLTVVALAWAARHIVSLPIGVYQLSATLQLSPAQQFRPFAGAAVAGAGMVAAVEIVRLFLPGPGFLSLGGAILTGIASYVGIISLIDRPLLKELAARVRRRAHSAQI
jgi:O-antigen/teichoic acid export membrane protein